MKRPTVAVLLTAVVGVVVGAGLVSLELGAQGPTEWRQWGGPNRDFGRDATGLADSCLVVPRIRSPRDNSHLKDIVVPVLTHWREPNAVAGDCYWNRKEQMQWPNRRSAPIAELRCSVVHFTTVGTSNTQITNNQFGIGCNDAGQIFTDPDRSFSMSSPSS